MIKHASEIRLSRTFLIISLWCTYLCNPSFSQDNIDSLFSSVTDIKSDEQIIKTYWQLYYELSESDIDGSIEVLKTLKNLADTRQMEDDLRKVYYELGSQHYYQGRMDSALKYYSHLIREEKIVDKETRNAYSVLGTIYAFMNNVDSSLYFHNKVVESIAPSGEPYLMAMCNFAISEYHFGMYNSGLEHVLEAKKIALAQPDSFGQFLSQILSTEYALKLSSGFLLSENAIIELKESIKLIDNVAIRNGALQNLGNLFIEEGEIAYAKQLFNLALDELKESGADPSPSLIIGYAEIELRSGNKEEALKLLRQVISTFPQYSEIHTAYSKMIRLFGELNMSDSCAHYALFLEKSLLNKQAELEKKSLKKLESSIAVLKVRNALQQVEKEKHLLAIKIRNQWLLIALLISILLTFISLSYAIFQRQKFIRKKKDDIISNKNQKLLELSLKIAQKNELLNKIEELISDDHNQEDMIRNLSVKIRNATNIESDWDQFTKYFNDQNDGFYNALKSKFPELTNNDLRLCTLIRLRMSTKEIASVLNLSVASVKSSRHRLRKKLLISGTLDISDFLASF
jgi:tetratricopeptide (TPR) repeat protein